MQCSEGKGPPWRRLLESENGACFRLEDMGMGRLPGETRMHICSDLSITSGNEITPTPCLEYRQCSVGLLPIFRPEDLRLTTRKYGIRIRKQRKCADQATGRTRVGVGAIGDERAGERVGRVDERAGERAGKRRAGERAGERKAGERRTGERRTGERRTGERAGAGTRGEGRAGARIGAGVGRVGAVGADRGGVGADRARALSSVQAQIEAGAQALTDALAEARGVAQDKELAEAQEVEALEAARVEARVEALWTARARETRLAARAQELAMVKMMQATRAKTMAEAEARWAARDKELARKQQAAAWVKVVKVAKELADAQQVAARAQALAVVFAELAELVENKRVTPSLPQVVQSHPYEPTYDEVVADLEIKAIIDSVDPDYRHALARHIWRRSEYSWLIQIIAPVTRLPSELLQSILSTIIDDTSGPPLALMLVCKHWYTSVTGIWASLKLGTKTPRDTVTRRLEGNQFPLDISFDTEIDRGDFTPSEGAYEAIFTAIEATSRWRSLVVETIPGQADLPEHLVNRGLLRCSNAIMSQLKTFTVRSACKVSPLLDRLLRILATTAGPKRTTVEINSSNVISLLPAYSPIFRSVKVLVLDISGTHEPVDLLPHLHQLEELTASHLSLPTYGNDINLPFVNTLCHLTLRAVSIQWMSGRTFHVLESCTIRLPLRRHIPHIFSTIFPKCEHLTFQGYPLDILDGVSARKLVHLYVTSSGSFTGQGAQQLVWFSSRVLGESRLAPRILHISIEATSQAWMNALTFMPHLEELVIENTYPSSLRAKGLQSLVAQPVHASNTGVRSIPARWRAPSCPSLRRFGLKYHRWLRPSERFDLIPECVSVISSRERSKCSLQSFWVWMGSDQKDPLELIEETQINFEQVERLVNNSGINGKDVWLLVNMRLIEVIFKPPMRPFRYPVGRLVI